MQIRRLYIVLAVIFFLNANFVLRAAGSVNSPISGDSYKFETILPNLFRLKGGSNTYLLKSGNSAILIDAGSEKIPDHLGEIGVSKIEWILHTHYHRDQCLGDIMLKQQGSSIAIGGFEKEMLEPAGLHPPFKMPAEFMLNGELPGWGRRMAPFQKPGIDRIFKDNDLFDWKEYRIRVINTPGHTEGSITYFTEIAGRKIAFTGDLIMKGGHICDLYSMQWIYLENPGIDSTLVSLSRISVLNPDMLLPSHGEIADSPAADLTMLTARLLHLKDALRFDRAGRWNWSGFVQISPHVIQDCGTTTQFILSDQGDALLFDCGDEFTLARLAEAKRKFGIKRIDVIIPSHWHFDHVNGIPPIVKAEGSKVWVYEGLAEHLEFPWNFPTTCWSGITIKPDRILKRGEKFSWGGIEFKVYPNPAHMEEQMALSALADGLQFLFIGDGTSCDKQSHIRSVIHGYNGISLSTGLTGTAKSFFAANPYICVPAHSNGFATFEDTRDEYMEWAVNTTDALKSILPPDLPELGYDPYWAAFYPARIKISAGDKSPMMLRLKNNGNVTMEGNVRLKCYGNLLFDKQEFQYRLEPGESRDLNFIVKCPSAIITGLHIITADIECNHQMFAELPQGYIEE